MSPSSASAPMSARWPRSASTSTIFGFDVIHDPWPACRRLPVRHHRRQAFAAISSASSSFRVRGAYFVIVTISFAEVVRLVALNWVELTQGPAGAHQYPADHARLRLSGSITLWSKIGNYYLVLAVHRARLCDHRAAGEVAVRPRDDRAAARTRRWRFRSASSVTQYLVLAAVVSGAIAGAAGSLYAHYIHIIDPDDLHVSLYRDHGHHGDHRRQGHARRSDRRRPHLRIRAGHPARLCAPGSAVDPLRRADDPHRLYPAATASFPRSSAGSTERREGKARETRS